MRNEQPRKLVISEIKGGYNKVYITNSQPFDADILGRAFWVTKAGSNTTSLIKLDALTNYATLTGLDPSATYKVVGAFYDSMVDDTLLAAKVLVELSDEYTVETQGGPVILNITAEAIDVDIGVILPNLVFNIDGYCDTLVIEYKEEGTANWVNFYSGAMSNKISVPAPKVGKFNFRVKGIVYTNNGNISESSAYIEYPILINASFNLVNPSAPTSVTLKVGKVNDTFERYDVKVDWSWLKGTGAGLKSFVVQYTTQADYDVNGFSKAKNISAGQSTSAIINNFPYNIPHVIRVAAYSFSDTNNVAYSSAINLTINSSTILDTSFTKATLVDLSYNGIFGYRLEGANRIPTFALDAANGNFGIGTPVNGVFPIQLNGANGILTVDGGIITKSINAANFILTNFTGSDNPALYSEGKVYANDVNGIWTGYDNATGLYKFDLGNASKYIRWDGSDLLISGQVKIGTALGDINLENTVARRTVWVYREAAIKPPTPLGDTYPPSAWSTTPVAITNPSNVLWTSQGLLNTITNKLEVNTVWSAPVQFSGYDGVNGANGTNGTDGDSSFKSIVFVRSNTQPATPTGGSYLSPVPSGWSDGIPTGTSIVWSSSRILTKSGNSPQQATWSTPVQLTDTATLQIRYSNVLSSPGDPTSAPANWTTSSSVSTIWMAQRISTNGVWGAWEVSKIKGEDGSAGINGLNSASVFLYQRSATVPAKPTTTSTYTFATGILTGQGSSWTQSVPAGSAPLYVITATAASTTATDTIAATEWSSPTILAQDGNNGQPGANGLNNATIFLYQRASSTPSLPSTTVTYTFSTKSISGQNNGWVTSVPTGTLPVYVTAATASSSTDTDTIASNEWSTPSILAKDGADGTDGDSSFKSIVFVRSNTQPATPTGGSYLSPVPSGWSDGAPDGSTILWSSSRIFTKSGNSPQQAAWTTPVQLTDTATIQIRYSELANNPGDPTNNPVNWLTSASIYTVWMAQRISLNGVWNAWEISKIKGEAGTNGTNGTNGSRGGGFHVIATATGVWSDSVANSACPGGYPVIDDVVTIFKQTDTKVSSTKRYNGTSWVTPGLVVHGDMIATGTIAGDRITANTEITAPVIKGGTFVVQDNAATYFEVIRATPFGPNSLVQWYGKKLEGVNWNSSTLSPIYSGMTKSNARTYKGADGSVFFGGTFAAGTLSNSQTNTTHTATPATEITFNSNGGLLSITASFSFGAIMYGSTTGPYICPTTPALSVVTGTLFLEEKINNVWRVVNQQSISGSYGCTNGESAGGEPGVPGQAWTATTDSGSVFTIIDNKGISGVRNFRVRAILTNWFTTTQTYQRITIATSE